MSLWQVRSQILIHLASWGKRDIRNALNWGSERLDKLGHGKWVFYCCMDCAFCTVPAAFCNRGFYIDNLNWIFMTFITILTYDSGVK